MTDTTTQDFETAFAAFLVAAQAKCTADYVAFSGKASAEHVANYTPRLSAERGRRYIRTGAVLKCDGWKSPAKGARGNVYDAQGGCGRVRWTGVA